MAKKVTFTLSAEVVGEATSGLLMGEFNNWNYNDGISLKKQKDGSMTATASLEPGKRYEYRYLLNDGRWVNDHSADHYVHISGLHVDNCVITVPDEAKEAKKAAVKAPKEKAAPSAEKAKVPAKKTAPAKEKGVVVKTAAPKAKTTKAKPTDNKA
ncbi:isoamylase early set domain-containing protein [Ferruginibacter paludis]|uniref:isoamylase early set domain-containing protein n=1 Tax=Ferruginibacter paludis TaxID=1310417 RepID=UPI0025B4FAAB|nr:isoamylase early set domain-containing protein [Ferruginibacter paludis]MDN3656936.1 isoamylase early set domain-containing protein [Ferruginibacter paludis]